MGLQVFRGLKKRRVFHTEVYTRLGGKFDVNERKDVLEKMERKKMGYVFPVNFP